MLARSVGPVRGWGAATVLLGAATFIAAASAGCGAGSSSETFPGCTTVLDARVNVNGLEHDDCAVTLAGATASLAYDVVAPPSVDGGVDGTASNALDPLTCGVDPGEFFDVACPGQTASTPGIRCRRSSRCLWITADGAAANSLVDALGGADRGAALTVRCAATDAVTSARVSLCAQ